MLTRPLTREEKTDWSFAALAGKEGRPGPDGSFIKGTLGHLEADEAYFKEVDARIATLNGLVRDAITKLDQVLLKQDEAGTIKLPSWLFGGARVPSRWVSMTLAGLFTLLLVFLIRLPRSELLGFGQTVVREVRRPTNEAAKPSAAAKPPDLGVPEPE